MELNDKAVDFNLKSVDGKQYSLRDFYGANALVVIFSCNHCPYVQAYEDRMIAIQKDYRDQGVRLVAINSNDADTYPEDGFSAMVARAKMKGLNFPYLRDDSQEVARGYGATHTPHLFVFDRDGKLAYTGKIDDNWEKPLEVKRQFLREALDDLLEGRKPRVPETHAIGCTIKWKR